MRCTFHSQLNGDCSLAQGWLQEWFLELTRFTFSSHLLTGRDIHLQRLWPLQNSWHSTNLQ
nr:MAG TPA: hypothetical protein [Caudoviricetes sp.]DAS51591.1 MAG TPA: hypothetical protein [Caudoviricetes sp.]DAX21987.1 MAG TPA: hypothetical protein [Caudoviricetes sp.]